MRERIIMLLPRLYDVASRTGLILNAEIVHVYELQAPKLATPRQICVPRPQLSVGKLDPSF